jgi:hypothetical protein
VDPLAACHAKTLAKKILEAEDGEIVFTDHCNAELAKDDRSTGDCLNAIRGGAYHEAEFENGSWRYRIETGKVGVIFQFRSETEILVVTAWRMK